MTEEDEFKKLCSDMSICIDTLTEIGDLLQAYESFNEGIKEANELNEKLRNKIKNYLKERSWTHYLDNKSKISVSIDTIKKETIDKNQLKILLTSSQYAQVIKITKYERLNILTEKNKKELSKFVGN